ncbi:hypothetical protein FWH13_00100 [Candidatus Saccharibacteria bacterium]|nr:hypothetical protein [Candidatus Saccharibacteria bacterium]
MRHFDASRKKWLLPAAIGVVALGVGGAMLWSTVARYASTGTATGTATIAAWNVEAKIGNDVATPWTNISGAGNTAIGTFALSSATSNPFIEGDLVAPGSVLESEVLSVRAAGSEVAVEYVFSLGSEANASAFKIDDVKIANLATLPQGLQDTIAVETSPEGGLRVVVPLAFVGETIEFQVIARWIGLCTDDGAPADCDQDAMNAANTARGIAGGNTTFPVNVTARQHLGNF